MYNERSTPIESNCFGASLDAMRQGSSSALGEVLETCRGYLIVVAARELRPDLRAKISPLDLVQETCVEAQRSFNRFHGETKQELIAWLRAILLHRVQKAERMFRQSAKRQMSKEVPLFKSNSMIEPALNAPDPAGFPGRRLAAEEDAANMALALARLPADHQKVIRMRNWELRSFTEIGDQLQRTAEAARSLWSRAIQRLTEELERCDAE